MGRIVLILFSMWILWVIISFVVSRIRESIEDRTIKKMGVNEELRAATNTFKESIETQLKQTKTEITAIREMSFQQLPNLKDRIERDGRRVDYIKNYLPFKSNAKRRRR